jgi:hypothetical protein
VSDRNRRPVPVERVNLLDPFDVERIVSDRNRRPVPIERDPL